MNTRGLPGMFAPMYQVSAVGNSEACASSWLCTTQASSACGAGSMARAPRSRTAPMIRAMNSTCCSIDTGMFDSTDGLCGPVMVNRFGYPALISPR